MAGIPYSVGKSIDDFLVGDLEGAMLHACNAVDGTARRSYVDFKDGNKARFTKLLRENYDILRPMSFPGLDIEKIRWAVKLSSKQKSNEWPDTADIIYCVHRCAHGHGDDLPEGFELIPDALTDNKEKTTFHIEPGKVRISDRTIFGLLAIAVLSPVNSELKTKPGHWLSLREHQFLINEWWGRKNEFLAVAVKYDELRVNLDLGNWFNSLETSSSK